VCTRADSLELQLATLMAQFRAGTGIQSSTLQQRVAGLRAQEASHATTGAELRVAEAQLERLQLEVPPRTTRIAQKAAVVSTLRAELDGVVAAIAQTNEQFAAMEAALTGGNDTGTASLHWAIPTTRANGLPLAAGELGGYEIYMLSESTGVSTVITVGDPFATSYEVGGLSPDTYHFSIAAFDSAGKLSELSAVVSKTVL
jgi:hypothetical protein